MKTFSISLAQINILFGQPEANLRRAGEAISAARRAGSHLILFPELWTTGYDLENGRAHAAANLPLIAEIHHLAEQQEMFIGGSYLLETGGDITNTFLLAGPGGYDRRYSKIHLFRLMNEPAFLQPGSHLQTAELPIGTAGMAICYDLRFPEQFRTYALQDALLFLLVAEWPALRRMHWNTLLHARAIENQVFVAAVNSVGKTSVETFAGSSLLIDPWGESVCEGSPTEEQILTGELELSLLASVRNKIPVFTDRRPDLY
jgi:omega-amidase